jgi:hypothetical protein
VLRLVLCSSGEGPQTAITTIMYQRFAMRVGRRLRPFRLAGPLSLLVVLLFAGAGQLYAQGHEDEIVANLAGGRVIVHVAREVIILAAIDHPVERNSIPPRVMDLDGTHVGVLLGASEWQIPADPKPIRLDRNFHRAGAIDSHYQASPDAEPDLESIGTTFLEKLRPLVAQLRNKLDFSPDEPIFQIVVVGFAPSDYGPEVWVVEYRLEQEQVATRGEYWQTRILRPRFTQLYPPEKHAPRTLVESRYPPDMKGPTLREMIQSNDPQVVGIATGQPRFEKVIENLHGGQAQKAVVADSIDFMRAVLPVIAGDSRYVLGTMEESRGFAWIVPPTEPIEKAQEDKNHPPEAPTLRKRIKP